MIEPRELPKHIESLMRPEELEFLATLAQQAPATGPIVELGTYAGASCAALCLGCGDFSRVWTVDDWSMQRESRTTARRARHSLRQLNLCPHVVTADTAKIPPQIPKPFAMLISDTDHREKPLRRETDLWLPHVMPGGLAVFHDYGTFESVTRVVSTLLAGWQRVGTVRSLIAFIAAK